MAVDNNVRGKKKAYTRTYTSLSPPIHGGPAAGSRVCPRQRVPVWDFAMLALVTRVKPTLIYVYRKFSVFTV